MVPAKHSYFLLITAISAVGYLLTSCNTSNSDPEKASVESVVAGIIEADNRSDLQTVLSFYCEDAELLPPGKPPIIGIDAIKRNYTTIFETSSLQIIVSIDETKISPDGWALVTGRNSGSVTDKTTGIKKSIDDKFMMLLVNESNSWKIKRLIWSPNDQ